MTLPAIERPTSGRHHRSFLQRRADDDLATHPYRLEIVGSLGALTWPPVCAGCGVDTSERLTVRKVFGRPRSFTRSRHYRRQIITAASIPYCATCNARHRALTPPRNLVGDLWHMLWPVLLPMAGAGWFFLLTLRLALEEQARGDVALRYVWPLPALFAFIVVWCVAIAWWSSRALRVERQSDVTRACDFSDDVSWYWERERRIYALANARFARALADANARRMWTRDDDRRSARFASTALGVAGIAIVVAWAVVRFAR